MKLPKMFNTRATLSQMYRTSISERRRSLYLKPRREEDDEIIMRFISSKDIPDWYRGASIYQLEATDALLNALRDDAEQNTTHRVRTCLRKIGIEPLIGTQETRMLMRLARGNDLAFLWFLRELHYQTDAQEYSLNEQLIYSAICHLDMVTTLRELDRILPPPQLSKSKISELNKKDKVAERNKRKDRDFRKKWLEWKKGGLGPYFEPIKMPRTNRIELSAVKPPFRMNFAPYDVYKSPSYVVPNEYNRWFADYRLQPSKRIANVIIDEEIRNIFNTTGGSTLPKEDNVKSLCQHHKHLAKLEKNLETELKVIARDHCLQLKSEHDVQDRSKLVRQQLQQEIDCYMAQFRRMTAKMRKRCCSNTVCNDTQLAYVVRDVFDFSCLPLDSVSEQQSWEDRACGDIKDVKIQELKPTANCNGGDVFRLVGGGGGDDYDINDMCSRCKLRKFFSQSNAKDFSFVFPGPTECKQSSDSGVKNYNYGHSDKSTPTTTHRYFQAPDTHRPYKFDYRKIFRLKQKSSECVNISKALAEAVDSHIHMLELLEDAPPDIDAAVNNCAKRIWKKNLACRIAKKKPKVEAGTEGEPAYMLEEKSEEDQKSSQSSSSCKADMTKEPPVSKESPLPKYNADYYDPDDLDLMQEILKDALGYMKKDPKFVLASMPDAYKVPGLKLWVCDRFGKRYNEKELKSSLKTSYKTWKALNKVCAAQPMPPLCNINKDCLIDYSHHKVLMKKAAKIKKGYFNEINDAVMDQARVFWFAFQPYLCAGGPPRETYYAYMPARIKDIDQGGIRPWRPFEFMQAAIAWDARQQQKRKDSTIRPINQT